MTESIPQAVRQLVDEFTVQYGGEMSRALTMMERGPLLGPRAAGLRSSPWHEPSDFKEAELLEREFAVIRHELLGALDAREGCQEYEQRGAAFVPVGKWKSMYFVRGVDKFPEHCACCPRTASVIDRIDGHSLAMFSGLLPDGHIAPHNGLTSLRLTAHLGLSLTERSSLRVGTETRQWREGECLVFDDSFEHEAINRSDRPRIVLLVDFWHPDLTGIERTFFERLQLLGASAHGSAMPSTANSTDYSWWSSVTP